MLKYMTQFFYVKKLFILYYENNKNMLAANIRLLFLQ